MTSCIKWHEMVTKDAKVAAQAVTLRKCCPKMINLNQL